MTAGENVHLISQRSTLPHLDLKYTYTNMQQRWRWSIEKLCCRTLKKQDLTPAMFWHRTDRLTPVMVQHQTDRTTPVMVRHQRDKTTPVMVQHQTDRITWLTVSQQEKRRAVQRIRKMRRMKKRNILADQSESFGLFLSVIVCACACVCVCATVCLHDMTIDSGAGCVSL